MTAPDLSRPALHRLVTALMGAELSRLRGPDGGKKIAWAGTPEAALGLDSLERMGVLSALCEAFDLGQDAFGPEPIDTVAGWVDRVAAARPERLVISTSGSTGAPKLCPHGLDTLLAEADWFTGALPPCQRVIAMVPANHLYGVVWTVLLPDAMDAPVVTGEVGAMPDLAEGDLIVAVPDQWMALSRLNVGWPAGVFGVSSAGRLPDQTAERLLTDGLSRLFDVYGASETSAIGLRECPEPGYALLPRWRLEDGAPQRLVDDQGVRAACPDHLERLAGDRVVPRGRVDTAVQVGGQNVHPTHVADELRRVEGVAEIAVRLGQNGRLKAFVVPTGADIGGIEGRLHAHATAHLSTAERPTSVRFGDALPRNAMGKAADWS